MTDRWRSEFEELFGGSFDTCCAAARRIVGDQAVAEELAAEAFVRAWTRWPWLRLQGSPLGWLIRVTSNLALDHVRRGPAPAVVSPDAYLLLDDAVVTRITVVDALGRLSARQREALSLHYLAGLEEGEVAAAMGLSAGSVKTHLHRGRARLRRILTVEEPVLEVRLAPRQ
jgi:RNA polymerase sigma-70 factor, ECF subfamily